MNKKNLIDEVASKAEISKVEAGQIVDALFSSISDALKEGKKVQLIGFGSFEVKERAARKGRNPQTGDELTIPATTLPVFKAGKALKYR